VLQAPVEEFAERLRSANHTLKRALTDPHLVSGIGNAYSDEILHAARLSPLQLTRNLCDDEMVRLHASVGCAAWPRTDTRRGFAYIQGSSAVGS
jgi:formamidopyrimidine-DNA glycosylase